ncbi:MAG: hypothetical protein EZS28_044662 [Streblomastix strix]|uniref:Uncharacterized protein n=1 Tax=Streblomastix strix TaxID=222440 RepID=A0A5J4TPI2_9EUKA|nr:MAG: hypothetical protein EZS28_044662 [Streblomastix strix]
MYSNENPAFDQNSLQYLNVKGFCVASLLCHFEFLYLITQGSLTKSYPLFYYVLRTVSISILCGDKCSIVIPGITSSRKSSSLDSSAFLCVGDIDLQLCLGYQFLSVVQGSSGIREVCCCGCAGIGGINILRTLLIDVVLCHGLSTLSFAYLCLRWVQRWTKMDLVVGQLGTELVTSGIALVARSIGRGIMVVIIPISISGGAGCKNE